MTYFLKEEHLILTIPNGISLGEGEQVCIAYCIELWSCSGRTSEAECACGLANFLKGEWMEVR